MISLRSSSIGVFALVVASCGSASYPEEPVAELVVDETVAVENTPPEPDDPAGAQRSACTERRDPTACDELGESASMRIEVDVTSAARDLRIACDGGIHRACHNLGVVMLAGAMNVPNYGYPQDLATARQLFVNACEAGYEGACLNAALMLATGSGGPEELPAGLALATRLCDAGDQSACDLKDRILRVQEDREAASSPPVPEGPHYNTTIGELSVNGGTFRNIGATCGMFQLMGVFQDIRNRVRQCVRGERTATVTLSLESGRVTSATGEADPGSTCAARALQRATVGSTTCDLHVTIVD